MKAILARIFPIALFLFCSGDVANAFHLRPHRVGTTTAASTVSSSHRRLPGVVVTNFDGHGNNRVEYTTRSPRLFAAASDHGLKKKRSLVRLLFRQFSSFLRHSKKLLCRPRALVATVLLYVMINLSVLPSWAAPSNGRMGASFGRSDRFRSPPITRTVRPSRVDRPIRAPTRVMLPPRRLGRSNRIYHNFHQANGEQAAGEGIAVLTNEDGTTSYVRKVSTDPFSNSKYSASDIVFVSGVTAVVTKGVLKRRADREKYGDENSALNPLGPGISVWCMTACLNVPDINDPTSIVRRLQRLGETTSTETRKGLQKTLAETSLELLRQLDKGAVASVESRYDHYRSSDQAAVRAERQYNRISTKERSKFDRESWSSYNGNIVTDNVEEGDEASFPLENKGTSSVALVQIHVVIEGDEMEPFGTRQMETRQSFREALLQLSGDVTAVEDCVLAGEVLWAPQQQSQQEEDGHQQVMTEEDVYAKYPTLWPVDYSIA